jgi:hypothetical protein
VSVGSVSLHTMLREERSDGLTPPLELLGFVWGEGGGAAGGGDGGWGGEQQLYNIRQQLDNN